MHPERWRTALVIASGFIFLPYLIFGIGPHRIIERLQPSFIEQAETLISDTWQILASVFAISIVIVVFLTQYVHEREYERRAFPLFASRTWMVFTVMFGLLTIASMGITVFLLHARNIEPGFLIGITGYNLTLFLVNIALTIRLYIQTYLFLSPRHFQNAFLKYNQKMVAESVRRELLIRIIQSLVIETCERNGIDFSLWDRFPDKSAIRLSGLTREIYSIVDVNLVLLEIVGRRVSNSLSGKDDKAVRFLGQLGVRVSAEKPFVAFVSPELDCPRITHLLRKAVRISPLSTVKRTAPDDELLLQRDLLSTAIEARRAGDVEKLLNVYQDTLGAFLQAVETFGLRFTSERAEKETGFFADWPVLSSIYEQIFGLIDQALKSENSDIIHHFVGFPFHIMVDAFQRQDHLVFRRFSYLYPTIYAKAKRILNVPAIKEYVLDRCSRLIIEFDTYIIPHSLESPMSSSDEIRQITNYSAHLLLVLNRLMKTAIDFRELDDFRRYATAAGQIFQQSCQDVDESKLGFLEMRLSLVEVEKDRTQLEKEYDRSRALFAQCVRIRDFRNILFIGLGAWLCHLNDSQKLTESEFREYILIVDSSFQDVEGLYTTFAQILMGGPDNEPSDWDSWEMEEWPENYGEMKAGWIQFSEWIEKYYFFRALALSPNDPNAIPELPPTDVSQRVYEVVEKQQSIFQENNLWRSIVFSEGEEAFQQGLATLRLMHENAVEKQEVIEENELAQQPLDQNLVRQFVADVEKAWLKNSTIRGLVNIYGRYEPRPNAAVPEGLRQFGIPPRIDRKLAFVQQDRVIYSRWGENFGRGLARGEDSFLAAEFSQFQSEEVEISEFDGILCKRLTELRSMGLNPIILCSRMATVKVLLQSPHFEPGWRTKRTLPEVVGVDGFYNDALVVVLEELKPVNDVVLVDLLNYGLLVQYRPDDSGQFPLSIKVEEFTSDKAEEILAKDSGWAKNPKTGEMHEPEAALRRIQNYVGIRIWERFCVEEKNNEAGRLIRFRQEVTGSDDP